MSISFLFESYGFSLALRWLLVAWLLVRVLLTGSCPGCPILACTDSWNISMCIAWHKGMFEGVFWEQLEQCPGQGESALAVCTSTLDILANRPISRGQDSSWKEWVGASHRGIWEPTSMHVCVYVCMLWSAVMALEQNQERTELSGQRYRRTPSIRVQNLVSEIFISLLQAEALTTCSLLPGNGVTIVREF